MAAPEDKQFLFDWPQDTEASPDKEDVASVELNREAESRLRAATAELAEAPTDPELLLNTALAALLEEQPELSLRYQHRFSKRYAAMVAEDQLLRAVALGVTSASQREGACNICSRDREFLARNAKRAQFHTASAAHSARAMWGYHFIDHWEFLSLPAKRVNSWRLEKSYLQSGDV